LDFIDLGGGFGIPYKPDEEELDLNTLGNQFNERFLRFCKSYGKELELRLEPGRYIIAQAGHLLVKVTTIKENPQGKTFVGVNSGMNHMIRVALYDAHHKITNLSNPNGEQRVYDVCGNVCESSDFFAKGRQIPEIREGDVISIENTGAYGFAMSSDYQLRSRPSEVIADGSKTFLSRKRETLRNLLSRYEKLNQNHQS
jgi:diaminopimelate decarboxylase